MGSAAGRLWRRWVDAPKAVCLLTGVVIGVAALGAAAWGTVLSGAFDMAASVPHGRLAYRILDTVKLHSVRRHARGIRVPARFTADEMRAGFRLYDAHCVTCHGGPGIAPAPLSYGLNPPPPYLINSPDRWRPNELYWIIRNGEKMTAMPAWKGRLSAREAWNLVAFIEALRSLDYPGYLAMRQAEPPPPTDPSPAPPTP
ncbi:cytochrome c [Phenylobacterium sp.]|uniref:c-type cytochrome n=1 Tax=Phenylobacterium sp. TaxID=1871053 RepID=UPI002D7F299F|nr:cytochrome c [Phenylobacterium sp.]